MPISLHIDAENEHEFRRVLTTLATPYLADLMAEHLDASDAPASTDAPAAVQEPAPDQTKSKGGRPKGSTNKPKTNGAEPQTEARDSEKAQPNGSIFMPLTEQIQIITDAAHDQPDRFKPLLAPLREQLGVQYISKAGEKDREVLQAFINEHGLAV